MDSPDNDEKVQVLTVGGAANLQSSSKKKRRKKKKKKKEPVNQRSSETDLLSATNTDNTNALALESGDPAVDESAETQQTEEKTTPITESLDTSALELEESERENDDDHRHTNDDPWSSFTKPRPVYSDLLDRSSLEEEDKRNHDDPLMRSPSVKSVVQIDDLYQQHDDTDNKSHDLFWLFLCFMGIMASFVCYGLLLEYATSGGRKLHELSFLFVTSGLYTQIAAAGRYIRAETPTTMPPARFAVLGLTSMGSTFCSVRSLR